jgi:SAM-dependent methyltransferase
VRISWFDANPTYIASAQQRYGNRGEFVCERVSHHSVQHFGAFDIVLALGLIHHLEDSEAKDLFRIGYTALKPGGRMITNDGCYAVGQSAAKRFLLSRDGGRFVRTQEQYVELVHSWFQEVNPHLREDVLRIPYTHLPRTAHPHRFRFVKLSCTNRLIPLLDFKAW